MLQNEFLIPTEINEDLAYLVGSLLGDGCIARKNTVSFSSIDKEFIEEIKRIITKYVSFFREKKPKLVTKRAHVYSLVIYCKALYQWLRNLTNNRTCVPNEIKVASPVLKKTFLRGIMDTDGSISKGKTISFRNNNEVLVNDTYNLFRDLNIRTSKAVENQELNTHINNKDYKCTQYYFYVNTKDYFDSGIGFVIDRKRNLLNEYINDNYMKNLRQVFNKIMNCHHCNYQWGTRSKLFKVTCPNCGCKTSNLKNL